MTFTAKQLKFLTLPDLKNAVLAADDLKMGRKANRVYLSLLMTECLKRNMHSEMGWLIGSLAM